MKLVVSSLLIAFASSAVAAAEPAASPAPAKIEAPSSQTLELARRFIKLTVSADQYIEMARAGFMGSTMSQLEGLETDDDFADAEEKLGKVWAKVEPSIRAQLPNLLEAYAEAHAREYTADELQQLITFAGSPAGRASSPGSSGSSSMRWATRTSGSAGASTSRATGAPRYRRVDPHGAVGIEGPLHVVERGDLRIAELHG